MVPRSSVSTTFVAGIAPVFVAVTEYSSSESGSAGPPPTTRTALAMKTCCALPTMMVVGW